MIETLMAGGPVMVPIAVCSVVALATLLERLWSLRRGAVVPKALVVEVVELLRQERFADAVTLCRTRDVAVSRVMEIAITSRASARSLIKERVEEVGRREAAELERYVPVLGTIASISPLLGLLGTVGGMIVTFEVIAQQGGVTDVAPLAGGISQALITTFAGLSVGTPAVVANRYILAKVDALLVDMEEVALGVIDVLVEGRAEGAT